MRSYFAVLVAAVAFLVPWMALTHPEEAGRILSSMMDASRQFAAVVLHQPRTITELRSHYNDASAEPASVDPAVVQKKVRILIVPGHEPEQGGAEYGSLKERNMSVELATYLQQILSENPHYQVFISRGASSWNPIFDRYFKDQWSDIVSWQKLYKDEIKSLARVGDFKHIAPTVIHNRADDKMAYRLYGLTKWSNDNLVDIAIHIHFNDYPGHGLTQGKYSGFAIYVPEDQFYNSTTTKAVAESVFRRLSKFSAISDFPGEKKGIVEDQDLIAIGANNSSDAASMLIEYGYIYEPQFQSGDTRAAALKDMAYQTYLGIQDFFDPAGPIGLTGSGDTLLVPHKWSKPTIKESSSEILALQTALIMDGVYPPKNASKNDCPRTGSVGRCTKTAIDEFQKKYSISGENGSIGEKTISKLNELYGPRE